MSHRLTCEKRPSRKTDICALVIWCVSGCDASDAQSARNSCYKTGMTAAACPRSRVQPSAQKRLCLRNVKGREIRKVRGRQKAPPRTSFGSIDFGFGRGKATVTVNTRGTRFCSIFSIKIANQVKQHKRSLMMQLVFRFTWFLGQHL